MQSSIENTSSIGRKINVVVPADKVETAVKAKLQQLSKTVKMQGFRPGKVPMSIVEQQYRGSATSDVLGDLIQQSLHEALAKEEVVPAVQPDITPNPIEDGKDFSYTATFDVYPEFEKLDLSGVKVAKPESSVGDEDVQKVIENMRKQQLNWKEVKRKSKEGDRVIVDFSGTINGEAFDGGKADDYPVVIGEKQMLPEFEKGIKGMKAGDSADVEVNFPEDYQGDLAGKTAVFNIVAKTVSESELPEVDEEFIKTFGVESGKIEDLTTEVTQNLEISLTTKLSSMTRERAFDAILEQNDVEVPAKMVQEEAQRMIQEQKNQMQQQGVDPSLLPEPEFSVLEPQAKKRVSLSLILMEIVRKHDLKPDADRVKARIEKMAASYQDPKEFIAFYSSDQKALSQVQSIVLEEQVVDKLLESADISAETVDASEILNM